MSLADCVCPIGAYDELIEIANDEYRRIFQGERILLQLTKCGFQILPLTLVLPAEVAALPNVGPTLAAGCFRRTALKAVAFPGRIGFCWCWLAENMAEVDEVLLRRRPLFQLDRAPLADEGIDRQIARQSTPPALFHDA